jgi:hypothetical protein
MKYYTYDVDNDYNEVEVTEDVQDKIIKDYLMSRYHWVIGIAAFTIGLLIGLLQ